MIKTIEAKELIKDDESKILHLYLDDEYLRDLEFDKMKTLETVRMLRVFQEYCLHDHLRCDDCNFDGGVLGLTIGHVNNDGHNHRKEILDELCSREKSRRKAGTILGGVEFYRYLYNNNFPKNYALKIQCGGCQWIDVRRGGAKEISKKNKAKKLILVA